MPTTLESCLEFFETKDLYEIFEINKKATVAEGKQQKKFQTFMKSLIKSICSQKGLLQAGS